MKSIRQQVASALELIVHLERMDDGSRKITAITEVQRMEGDVIMLQDLFTFRLEAVTQGRAVVGELQACGLRPTFESKFRKHGLEMPADLFGPQPLAEAMAR
jgi:pilus assembly protein CpaF